MKFEHDPVKYREMSEPKTEEQAAADAEEFARGVYELREKPTSGACRCGTMRVSCEKHAAERMPHLSRREPVR